MMIQGTMISFNPSTKVAKKDGGQYDAWELVYRNTANEVKSLTKPAGGLQYNPGLKAALTNLAVGDLFTVVQEKNEKGYLDVKSIEKGHQEVQDVVASGSKADGGRAPSRGGKVLGSTYETPEERAKKQVIITRQASVNAAIEFLRNNKAITVDQVLDIAKSFEFHYNQDLDKAAKVYMSLNLNAE